MSAMASMSAPTYMPSTVALYNHPWSSSGSSYNINANSFEDDEVEQTGITSPNDAACSPQTVNRYRLLSSATQDHFLSHYFHVLSTQYHLADALSITDFIASLIRNSPSARYSSCMLSALHITTMRGSQMDQSAVTTTYR